MSLHIAIDASRTTVDRPTGTERYARRLIQSLIEANRTLDSPHRLELYFRDAPTSSPFPDDVHTRQRVIPWPRAWTHLRFAAEIWKTRPDVTFVPAHTLPFVFPGKALVTVHDLGYRFFPEAHPAPHRAYLELTTRFSQSRATLVLADSQATADDLAKIYGTPPAKIRVLYPGVDPAPLKSDPARIDLARAKYKLPQRYFLFIGTLQPRKNIERIVKAFALLRAESGDEETALALAGGKGWLFDERWVRGTENVRLTGYIDDADKGPLLAGALALVYPSLYEGFGFPAIEAMICGAPVIASASSSLAELVGDAGILVDPLRVEEIAAAMRQVSDNGALRAHLVERGKQRAKAFTWEASARQLLRIIDELQEHR